MNVSTLISSVSTFSILLMLVSCGEKGLDSSSTSAENSRILSTLDCFPDKPKSSWSFNWSSCDKTPTRLDKINEILNIVDGRDLGLISGVYDLNDDDLDELYCNCIE